MSPGSARAPGTRPGKEREDGAIPVVGFVGYQGSGKTTLVVKVIRELAGRGYRIATIKHVHTFNVEKEGKDTWRHRDAGASLSIAACEGEVVVVHPPPQENTPEEIAAGFVYEADLVLVEGFKQARLPKIEVHRREVNEELACRGDEYLLAVASDEPVDASVPWFSLEDARGIADFLENRFLKGK